MAREPDPLNDEELFNSIDLGGVFSPGTVKLSGHNDKVGWDVKAGSGQKGATMTRKGAVPPEFTATFTLATEEQIALWPEFRDAINATVAGKTTKAVDIYHPDLATVGITSVVKGELGGVAHDGKGGQTIAVKFQVYAPPAATGGSPSGSKAKKGPDPNAAALARLAELTEEYKKTPWTKPS
jgi:hypothetical protein